MAGPGNTSTRSYNFFVDGTIVAGGYAANEHVFIDLDDQTEFVSKVVQIINDSGADITFRWTPDPIAGAGAGVAHGRVAAGEPLTQDFRRQRRIYLDGAPGSTFRLFAW